MRPASFADTLYALGHWLMSEDRPGDAAHVYRAMLTTVPADERGWLGLAGTTSSVVRTTSPTASTASPRPPSRARTAPPSGGPAS